MADSHPFSNAGLGMFGADSSIARQASTPEGLMEKLSKGDPLLFAAAALANKFFGKKEGDAEIDGAVPAPDTGAPISPSIFGSTQPSVPSAPSAPSYRSFLDMLPSGNK